MIVERADPEPCIHSTYRPRPANPGPNRIGYVPFSPQTYAAILACLLISLWTGRKPTLRTYEMLCWYFTGMADEEELLAHIQRLQKHDRIV